MTKILFGTPNSKTKGSLGLLLKISTENPVLSKWVDQECKHYHISRENFKSMICNHVVSRCFKISEHRLYYQIRERTPELVEQLKQQLWGIFWSKRAFLEVIGEQNS